MPIYEYLCQGCGNKFEIKVSLAEKEKGLKVICPSCEGNKTIQILGNFFTFSKGNASAPSAGCGPSCKNCPSFRWG